MTSLEHLSQAQLDAMRGWLASDARTTWPNGAQIGADEYYAALADATVVSRIGSRYPGGVSAFIREHEGSWFPEPTDPFLALEYWPKDV